MKPVALNNAASEINPRGAWHIVAVVIVAHILFVVVFKYGVPEFSPRRSEITIELGAALPRGEAGYGIRQATRPVTESVPKKAVVQDDNATRRVAEKSQAESSKPGASARSAGIDSAPMVDADYKAAYLNNPKPPYPPVAFQLRIEGTVRLKALVLPDGSCGEVLLAQSSGNELLDQSALNTVAKWKFSPAKLQGKDVSQWVAIPITFALKRR